MSSWAQFAANAVLVLHVAYVSFVVFGLLLTVLGGLLRWRWVRNFWFRLVHLTAIVIVVVEAWLAITCPLTTFENVLRQQAGMAAYEGDFIAIWLHELIFYDFPPWVFTTGYTAFGIAVVLTCFLVPPRRPRGRKGPTDAMPPLAPR